MKAVLALFLLLVIASCTTTGSPARSKLVGNWRYSDAIQSCHYSFNADGSFSGEVTRGGKLVLKFAGQWKMEKHAILYVYLSETRGRIPRGTTDRDQLIELEEDSFVIQAANGERRRYVRGS
ncbi:MAG TPA: hypothetical protein VH188_11405 [Chthoniobacterales bacterium]|jgi:hypothetical protein|nr:hypothetical protein [Chthoniobacterales bacterium]